MKNQVFVLTPDNRERRLFTEPGDCEMKLSAWLERRGAPLNTRCGQMGLCRGCEVILETATAISTERSCRLSVGQLPVDLVRLQIPSNSWRDNSLNGVSAFELPADATSIQARPGVGLALDIGTTTVAAALWDLRNGLCLGMAVRANAQGRFGDNVLTRVNFACSRADGPTELQAALTCDTLVPLLEELCAEAGFTFDAITEAVAAGNTVMLHTLSGEDLAGFARYPFKPNFMASQSWFARDLGLPLDIQVRTPPCLGSFVGADITAGALASGMLQADGPALLIDFGTNGEILLKHPSGYLATATAMGPAFEGGRLNCGATAGPGVASHISWHDGQWDIMTVDGNPRPARALSGAAYIDFIALANARGLLQEMGRYVADHPEVLLREIDGDTERYLPLTRQLCVTESDIAEIFQAKAAIIAGVLTLLDLAGLDLSEIMRVYIAGSFGYHLSIENAVRIGLLPNLPMERFSVIGNASLGGASLQLLAGHEATGTLLLKDCRTIELNQCAEFEDHFIDCLSLPH